MKIINNVDKLVAFEEIKVGACCLYAGCLYIRMNQVKTNANAANAFNFDDNAIAFIGPHIKVQQVEAEIIIRSKGVQ